MLLIEREDDMILTLPGYITLAHARYKSHCLPFISLVLHPPSLRQDLICNKRLHSYPKTSRVIIDLCIPRVTYYGATA